MRSNKTVALSKGLSLAILPILKENQVVVPQGKNYVWCCDVSGSMYGSLAQMRTQIKNRMALKMGPDDTMTIIWFSGKGQAGILMEMVKTPDLLALKEVHDSVDKYLQPVGLTCFSDPLKITSEVIDRITKKNQNPIAFGFLSDGYNNDCPWSEVETQIKKLEGRVHSTTVIEYGYYADSSKLSEMAENLGGTKISAQDFEGYEVAIEQMVTGMTSKLIPVDISSFKKDLRYQFLYAINENGVICSYSSEGLTSVNVPEHLNELYAVVKAKNEGVNPAEWPFVDNAILSAIFLMADKGRVDVCEELLYSRGDKTLINLYANAFGKQKLMEFKDNISLQILGEKPRWEGNREENFRPKRNTYCVLDLLDDLCSSDENKILPYHKEFEYSRIGAKTVTSKLIDEATSKRLAEVKTATKAEAILDEIEVAQFTPADKNEGCSVSSLTWNEDRANISLLFKIPGKVKLPENNLGLDEVDTFIFRNYNVVKDGILNITKFPCRLTDETFAKLSKHLTLTTIEDNITLVDFSGIPVINKVRIDKVKAKDLAMIEVNKINWQAAKKYLGYLKKKLPAQVTGTSKYTSEQISFLAANGVTPHNGFSPKSERVESTDFYIANALVTKIEKFSSLPKIEDVFEKRKEGKKLTASEELLGICIDHIDSLLGTTPTYEGIDDLEKKYSSRIRPAIKEIAQAKFSLIMSRGWFSDMKDTPAVISVNIANTPVNLEFSWKEEKVKL